MRDTMPKENDADLKDTFVEGKQKKAAKETPKAPTKEEAAIADFMNNVVSKLPREYAHSVSGVWIQQDRQLLLVPVDSLDTMRISIVLDENAVERLEDILKLRKKA